MKCPFCGKEMKIGYIQCRDGVYWSLKKRQVAALPPLDRSAVRLASSGDSPLKGAVAEAYLCSDCKKIVIDYEEKN